MRKHLRERLQSHPVYASSLAEEEAKLRWLAARQPDSRELRYYLVFMLIAHGHDMKALTECRKILDRHPEDVVARTWRQLLLAKWQQFPRRAMRRRPVKTSRWGRISRQTR